MPFNNVNEISAAASRGSPIPYSKASQATVAGYYSDLFGATGNPSSGATPPTGTGEVPTRSTVGSLVYSNASSGKTNHLVVGDMVSGVSGSLLLYDRLAHNSGLVGNSTTNQVFNLTPVNRPDTIGEGVEIWLINYGAAAGGFTSASVTVTYTNSQGVSGRVTQANVIGTVTFQQRMAVKLFLAAGDTGARSAQSLIWSPAGTAAGNFGVVLMRPIKTIGLPSANIGVNLDYAALLPSVVNTDACVAALWLPTGTASGNPQGSFTIAEGTT